MISSVIIFATVLLVVNCATNDTSISSKYAKVAVWGAATTPSPQSEARSNNGQPWTQRSDQKPSVVYHYPVQKKVAEVRSEPLPAIGEVQDRFNPRPYFDYQHVPSRYGPPKPPPAAPAPAPPPSKAPTFDSFPVFNAPKQQPPSDSYASAVDSYSPPKSGPVAPPDDNPGIAYPPNAPPTKDPTDGPPNEGYHYDPPKGPPKPPPTEESKTEQVYYPPSPDDHKEVILDHPPPGWKDSKDDEPKPMDMGKPMGMVKDMGEQDLAPPPSPDHYQDPFPQYLYNGPHAPQEQGFDFDHDHDHDHDHHVYKEVTTTTEAPEDERVNKGHYSYYYLGRKLWYIPLYFSVYFIIYVTVLILKSIARHKIQFKHNYFDHNRQARQMDLDEIDELHKNVETAIDTSRKKFTYVAM